MGASKGGTAREVVLVDANVIIEAVRIRSWKALVGGRRVETVPEVRSEPLNGNPHRPGRVTVTEQDLAGLAAVHPVTPAEYADFLLRYPNAPDMDPGERYLMAHVFARSARGDSVWVVCSPDKASVRAAVALRLQDQMVSLEELLDSVGERPGIPMKDQYTSAWLSAFKTRCLLG